MDFNIFKTLFSGYRGYKEEFSSQVLAFYLTPHMPHGFQDAILSGMLKKLGLQITYHWSENAHDYYCRDILGSLNSSSSDECEIQIESAPVPGDSGRIDILIRLGKNLLIVENKIYHGSVGEVFTQIEGYRDALFEWLKKKEYAFTIYPVIIFPKDYQKTLTKDVIYSCDWNDVCEIFEVALQSNPHAKGAAMLRDFMVYIQESYQGYRNSGDSMQKKDLQSFSEYMDEIEARGIPTDKVYAILSAWHEVSGVQDKNPASVYNGLNDGPVMWHYRKEGNGKWYFPFKISRKGTLIFQKNIMAAQRVVIDSEIMEMLYDGIFKKNMISCSVASLDGEKISKLKMIFDRVCRIIETQADR